MTILALSAIHYFKTLADNKKGSLTNRHQAGAEHFKNDVKYGTLLIVPTAATGIAIGTMGATRVATKVGKILSTATKTVGKLFTKTKLAKGISTLAEKIAKNPTKAGAIGLAVAGGLYITNIIAKYSNKKGKIDQKYEDAAKIESQTKNVVLEEKAAKKVEAKKTEQAPMYF